MVPAVVGGMFGVPCGCALSAFMTYSWASGEISVASASVNDCFENGGGLRGTGWVGYGFSPGISDAGAGCSDTPNSGLPVLRSRMKQYPVLVTCATASTSFPSCFTVTSTGGQGLSWSHRS